MHKSPVQKKVLDKVMRKTTIRISSVPSWLEKLGDPENERRTEVLNFINKIKLRKNWVKMTSKMRLTLFRKVITRISDLNTNQTKI